MLQSIHVCVLSLLRSETHGFEQIKLGHQLIVGPEGVLQSGNPGEHFIILALVKHGKGFIIIPKQTISLGHLAGCEIGIGENFSKTRIGVLGDDHSLIFFGPIMIAGRQRRKIQLIEGFQLFRSIRIFFQQRLEDFDRALEIIQPVPIQLSQQQHGLPDP